MKNLFLICTLLLWGATFSFSQNLVGNPGFETVTNSGDPVSKFNLEQVSRWKCFTDANEVRTQFNCSSSGALTPNSGSRMALIDVSNLGFFGPNQPTFDISYPLVNILTRPVFPGEKLTINYFGLIPGPTCAYFQSYIIDFYVSNLLPAGPYLLNGFTKIGTSYFQQQSNWAMVQVKGLDGSNIVRVPDNAGTCSYKYLILQVRSLTAAASGNSQSQERLITPKILLLDDISAQPACSSNLDVSITPMDDFGGQCNDVRFAASISNGTGLRFFWDFGDGTTQCSTTGLVVHSYPNMGDYTATLTVLDANGCTRVITIPVVVDCERCEGIGASFTTACQGCQQSFINDPVAGPTSFNIDCTYNLFGAGTPPVPGSPLSYQWVFNGGTVSTAQNPTNAHLILVGNTPPLNAKLCLSVMDNQGCKATTCETMTLPCLGDSGNKIATDPDGTFLVVPNPSTSSSVNLILPVSWIGQSLGLAIYDVSDRLMEKRQLDGNDSDLHLDLSKLENGVYYFSIQHAEGLTTKKVVIQN